MVGTDWRSRPLVGMWSFERVPARQMSPAPAGKVALPRVLRRRGRGGERTRDATREKKWSPRVRPTASRVTLRHPRFRMARVDAVGGDTGVATASQCGGQLLAVSNRNIKPPQGSGDATGTRKGSEPSRSAPTARNHRQ
jgi:hypothetical protein